MTPTSLNEIGLGLGMLGTLITFVWGLPQPEFADFIVIETDNPDHAKAKRRHKVKAKIGIGLIFAAFLLQFVALLMG